MSSHRPSVELRLAATLVHSIPGIGIEINDGGTDSLAVSFSPCELRAAIGRALGHIPGAPGNQALDDLVRTPNLSISIRGGHTRLFGGGIVGVVCCTRAVFAFTTTLPVPMVLAGMNIDRDLQIRTRIDEVLDTTLVYLEVALDRPLDVDWQETALKEIQEVLVGCVRSDIESCELDLERMGL